MKEIAVSKFKATCLAVIQEVNRTGEPVRLTKHGKPLVELVPAHPNGARGFIGAMAGTGKILGDIVSPVIDLDDFDCLK